MNKNNRYSFEWSDVNPVRELNYLNNRISFFASRMLENLRYNSWEDPSLEQFLLKGRWTLASSALGSGSGVGEANLNLETWLVSSRDWIIFTGVIVFRNLTVAISGSASKPSVIWSSATQIPSILDAILVCRARPWSWEPGCGDKNSAASWRGRSAACLLQRASRSRARPGSLAPWPGNHLGFPGFQGRALACLLCWLSASLRWLDFRAVHPVLFCLFKSTNLWLKINTYLYLAPFLFCPSQNTGLDVCFLSTSSMPTIGFSCFQISKNMCLCSQWVLMVSLTF